MPQQFLDHANIGSTVEEMGGETVPQGVWRHRALESGAPRPVALVNRGGATVLGRATHPTLADAAHALRPNLKVMLMTGYVHDGPQAASLLAPGMELVTKPFTAESLAARVQAMLDR